MKTFIHKGQTCSHITRPLWLTVRLYSIMALVAKTEIQATFYHKFTTYSPYSIISCFLFTVLQRVSFSAWVT